MAKPTRGVFIVWDTEECDVERRDVGTMQDRTVVTARRMVAKYALYSNEISDELIVRARDFVAKEKPSEHQMNMRVEVIRTDYSDLSTNDRLALLGMRADRIRPGEQGLRTGHYRRIVVVASGEDLGVMELDEVNAMCAKMESEQ